MSPEELRCPHHAGVPRKIDSIEVYGTSYGWMYVCEKFPECRCWVGCHQGTDTPLGQMCDQTTRTARQSAHKLFDQLWKAGWLRRNQAYDLLTRHMALGRDVHIGELDLEGCKRVCEIAERELNRLRVLGKPPYLKEVQLGQVQAEGTEPENQ